MDLRTRSPRVLRTSGGIAAPIVFAAVGLLGVAVEASSRRAMAEDAKGVSTAASSAASGSVKGAKSAEPVAGKVHGADDALRPKLTIERFTLENGLRVVLNPDPTSPTVAVAVWYDVGSRDEKPGEGGFAHLFEHMMFEGSAGVPRGEHDKLVIGRGGKLNASTSEDWTRYWEMMPSSELAVTLFLEADRMKSLKVTEEAFENQRKVVQEEYRMRVGNAPYVKGYFRMNELVYEGYHPYAHPAIGSMKELDDAKLEWVKAFHDSHYAPNNAVLVIAGDFASADATALVHKYFDGVPRRSVQAFEDAPFVARTTAAGPESMIDKFARTPMVYLGWSAPRDGSKEHYALEIAAEVLSGGESSRLHRRLVRDLAWAQSVDADMADRRGPDLFEIDAQLAECAGVAGAGKPTIDPTTKESRCTTPVKIEEVEKVLLAEIESLAKFGPTAAELATARAKVEHGFLFGLQANLSRALVLAKFEGHRGDASSLTTEVDRYLAVTADDVKAAVAKYLKRATMAHVRVVPAAPEKGDDGRGGGKPVADGVKSVKSVKSAKGTK